MENNSVIADRILSDEAVVTCLGLTPKYVLIAMMPVSILTTLDEKYQWLDRPPSTG